MNHGILQANVNNRGIVFDPRTKLLLLITMAVMVLGGAGSNIHPSVVHIFCALPLILLLSAKKIKSSIIYFVVYTIAFLAYNILGTKTTGFVNSMLLATCGIVTRFLPNLMMGTYLITTTTVSEFTAAMKRMHISEKIIIPLSVMFRFFPTVFDEFSSINSAMKMRGVSFGGKHFLKMFEYRIVPLMTCCVKIGEELSAAALTRGLGGEVKRTNVCKIGFKIIDVIAFLLCLASYVLLILSMCGIVIGG